jgi:hypothetical protein
MWDRKCAGCMNKETKALELVIFNKTCLNSYCRFTAWVDRQIRRIKTWLSFYNIDKIKNYVEVCQCKMSLESDIMLFLFPLIALSCRTFALRLRPWCRLFIQGFFIFSPHVLQNKVYYSCFCPFHLFCLRFNVVSPQKLRLLCRMTWQLIKNDLWRKQLEAPEA